MELSYSSKKLKSKKNKLKFSLYFFAVLLLIVISGLFVFYQMMKHNHWFNIRISLDIVTTLIECLVFLIILTGSLFAYYFLRYKYLNSRFKEFYIKLLEDEATLEGLTLFATKRKIKDQDLKQLKLYNGLEKIHVLEALTQSSNIVYFDLISICYENNQNGAIIKTKVDKFSNYLLQITNSDIKPVREYNDLPVKQYGIAKTNDDNRKYAIYTTLGTEVYELIKDDLMSLLTNFHEFMKAPITLTIFEDNLVIFLEGWKIDLRKSLKDKDSLSIIDAQIEALKRLQSYIEDIITLIGKGA